MEQQQQEEEEEEQQTVCDGAFSTSSMRYAEDEYAELLAEKLRVNLRLLRGALPAALLAAPEVTLSLHLSCPVLPCPAFPCPALPCLVLPCKVIS
jgi:hypothetical protein